MMLKSLLILLFPNDTVGACGPVDRALDSRSEGLGFDPQCWPCVEVSDKLVFHTASVHSAIMGTWCTGPRLDQQLQVALAPTLPGER